MPPSYSEPEESLAMVSDVSQMINNNNNNSIKSTTSTEVFEEDCGSEHPSGPEHVKSRRRGRLLGRVMGWDQHDEAIQQQRALTQERTSAFRYQLERSGSEESLRGYQDDENTEIWDLLNQSKSRIENATKTLRRQPRVDDDDDDDEISLSTTASSVTNDLDAKSLADTSERSCNSAMKLLEKSKKRLRSPEPGKKEKTSAECRNHVILDEKQSEEDALTLTEILIAIEAAEEAAHSGRDSFETPAAAELRKSAEQKELMLAMEAAEEAAKAGIEQFKLIARR